MSPCSQIRGAGVRGAHRKDGQFLIREAWELSWGDPEATATQAGSLLKAAGVCWAGTGRPQRAVAGFRGRRPWRGKQTCSALL